MANTLSVANFKTIVDNIAYQIGLVKAAYGDVATPDTAMYGAKLNRDRIVAFSDPEDWDIEYDLLPGTIATIAAYGVTTEQASKHSTLISALGSHFGATSLATWMADNSVRAHPNIKDVYSGLTANTTFCPTVITLATMGVTGDGAGTLVDGTDIDRTLYASAQLELYTQTAIGDANIVVTVTGKNDAGATVSLPATTIPLSSADYEPLVPSYRCNLYRWSCC
jgi:hypothetical protein